MRKATAFFLPLLLLAAAGCCCIPGTGGDGVPRKIEAWKQLSDQDEADVVPESRTVTFPRVANP